MIDYILIGVTCLTAGYGLRMAYDNLKGPKFNINDNKPTPQARPQQSEEDLWLEKEGGCKDD